MENREIYEKALDFYLSGDPLSVLGLLEEFLTDNPKHPYALYNVGKIHYELGNRELAKAYLEEALKIKPDLYEALRILADIYTDEGKIDKALELYRRLEKIHPSAEIYNNIGYFYQVKGEHEKAIE